MTYLHTIVGAGGLAEYWASMTPNVSYIDYCQCSGQHVRVGTISIAYSLVVKSNS